MSDESLRAAFDEFPGDVANRRGTLRVATIAAYGAAAVQIVGVVVLIILVTVSAPAANLTSSEEYANLDSKVLYALWEIRKLEEPLIQIFGLLQALAAIFVIPPIQSIRIIHQRHYLSK